MSREDGKGEDLAIRAWDPSKQLRVISEADIELSMGFLRCMPQQWFSGIAAQWLPLSHALVMELKVSDVKTASTLPNDVNIKFGYKASVDEEPLGIFFDERSARLVLDSVSPDGFNVANGVILEYLARRILTSFALSWTGSDSTTLKFYSLIEPSSISGKGVVKVTVQLNNEQCTIWFVVGPRLVDKMDGLWRRQLQSRSKTTENSGDYAIEIAQLGVPPEMLSQYLTFGTAIDLEIPVSDRAFLRSEDGRMLGCRLFAGSNKLGIELGPDSGPAPIVPAHTTRLAVSFGTIHLEATQLTELNQIGALWNTGLSLTDHLHMIINNEKVGDCTLGIYQGRFAVTVR